MSTFCSFELKWVRQRPLFALTTASLFLLFNINTIHAFAPLAPNQLTFVRTNNGSSKTIIIPASPRPSSNKKSFVPKTSCRRKETLLSAVPFLQFAAHASSKSTAAIPNNLFLMKDMSSALSSILSSADPDLEAEFLIDMGHLLLDLTAFFKFNGKFLNYAQLVGRISFILVGLIPGHALDWEDLALQLFFLGVNIQKVMPEFKTQEEAPPSSSSSSHISPSEIEQQQQQFNHCPNHYLLPEVPIAVSDNLHACDDEELTLDVWEEMELEMQESR